MPKGLAAIGLNKFKMLPITFRVLLLLGVNLVGYNHSSEAINLIYTSPPAVQDAATKEVSFDVKMVFQSDVGDEIFYLNKDDMLSYGIEENEVITLYSPTTSLSLPAKSHSRVDPGSVRMQQSVRQKLKIDVDELIIWR
ncbi:MAG: hypothetical protein SCK28_10295 [Bacillota bacterium]|nr:hypothetical protein [Bacillota bacterium]